MDINILEFGAAADGNTINSEAIQSAIDAYSRSGGGRVTVPQGIFVTGTIWLKSHVELHLSRGAVLKASPNIDDYNDPDAYPQNFGCPDSEKWVAKHLIIALECEDVALTGDGSIDGSGDAYYGEPEAYAKDCWKYGLALSKDPVILRPGQLVCFIECQNVKVTDVTLHNMTCWGCFLHGCDNVSVRGLKVFNPPTYANTDGIDIDSCSNVTVSDCIIDTGDDAIAIRGDSERLKQSGKVCEYITITNCVLGSASSVFRIGVGTGLIRHVRVSNLVVKRGSTIVNFMTDYVGHGGVSMEDIHFSGISAADIAYPIIMSENNHAYVRNVSIENVYAESYMGIILDAAHDDTLSDITLRNISIKRIEGPYTKQERQSMGGYLISARNISGLVLDHIHVESAPQLLEGLEGILRTISCSDLETTFLSLPKYEMI